MITAVYHFAGSKVKYYFEQSIKGVDSYCRRETTVFITDAHVFAHYAAFFEGRKTIVLEPGEEAKQFSVVAQVIDQLVAMGVTREYFIIGMGGGVISDLTGFVASIYMRGMPFAFIPTSLLAMVDAALGGKNGVNTGLYKNIAGVIRQPSWIIFDRTLLYTLPREEWINAFAEIIKYAAVFDESLFRLLEAHTLEEFQDKHYLTAKLLYICTHIKSLVVERDVFDNGERRLLNFGHTLGHAVEKLTHIAHGRAVAAGMLFAAALSEKYCGFTEADRLKRLIAKFELTPGFEYDKKQAMEILKMDKKRQAGHINFILLNATGRGVVKPIPVAELEQILTGQ